MKASLNSLKELLGQLEVLRTYYDRLTERERYIVISVGCSAIVLFMLLVYSIALATISRMDSRTEMGRENLQKLQDLRVQYNQTEKQIQQLERMMRRADPDFQLATHLDGLAKKHGVNIHSLKDLPSPPNDFYRETQVSVSIQQTSLRSIIDLLFEIENSRELLRITSLQIKPNFQDPTQLNVNFVVSTFQATGL